MTASPPATSRELGDARPLIDFELGSAGAAPCGEVSFRLPIKSSISGTVVGEKGEPVAEAFIQLQFPDQVGTGDYGMGYTTAADGRYEFTDLPPGRYVIGLNVGKREASSIHRFVSANAVTASGDSIIVLAFGERVSLRPLVARPARR